jgi:carboxypeptidase Taq
MKQKIEQYYQHLKEQKILEGIDALLNWDQEAVMPAGAVEFRSEQLSYVSKKHHEISTDKAYVSLVNDLYESRSTLDSVDARSIEVSKKNLDKSIKLPTEFVEEAAKATSLSHQAWLDAKSKEDFSIFQPHLEKQIELKKKYANYIDSSKPIYDVLIDDFEEGMTGEKIDAIFHNLKTELKSLLSKIKSKEKTGEFSKFKFETPKVKEFIQFMTARIGFDFNRGAAGEVHHPFESSLSPNDIRINMSYYHKDLSSSITGAIHELGHGLYEQNIDKKYHHTDLSAGVSLGIHESQSRLLENMVGRSKAFWNYFGNLMSDYLTFEPISPPSTPLRMTLGGEIQVENLVNDLNIVKPSLIRIEADEVTYNMHIILRYEIEQMMLNDQIKISELPEVWNSKMKELLNITPDKLSTGCLQDTHWSIGAIGYFPTYTLGNLVAGQLWNKFQSENPNFQTELLEGDFSSYFNWFKENIWQHGSFIKPNDLVKKVTGEELKSEYFIEYLRSKYL